MDSIMDNGSNSVVDLDDLQGGIPDFLQREPSNPSVLPGVPTTLVVGEGTPSSDDVALDVLKKLEDQITSQGTVLPYTANQERVEDYIAAHSPAAPDEAGATEYEQALVDRNTQERQEMNEGTPEIGHNQPADPAEMRREFFKDINKFGKASGEGASALGRLGLRCLRAAADGLISCEKPQKGGKDDSTLIYEAYTAMDSKHSEHTAGGAKANASKLRQIVAMGCMTTLSDPVAIGNRVVRLHEQMTDAELKPKALFAGLVDVARTQQASDSELTDAAIQECLTKTKADKTIEKEWEAINKRIEGLVTGESSHGLKDQSEGALKISQMVSEHLKQYKSDGTRQDRIEDMMELGYTREMATAIVDKKILEQ